jgi:hypothetical protein
MWRWFALHLCILRVLFPLVLITFSIDFNDLCSLHFDVLGGFVIVCRFIQRHIVALESDINIFKALLLHMRNHELESTSWQIAP